MGHVYGYEVSQVRIILMGVVMMMVLYCNDDDGGNGSFFRGDILNGIGYKLSID